MNNKLTLEQFKQFVNRLEALQEEDYTFLEKNKDNPNFDERKYESQFLDDYFTIQKELLSYDLSEIPEEEWKDVLLFSDMNHIADFSKTKANLDFKIFMKCDPSFFQFCNFRGCNISNIEECEYLVPDSFDEEIVQKFPSVFMLNTFSKEFMEKYYNDSLTIADIASLSKSQLEELKKKNFLNHCNRNSSILKLNSNLYFSIEKIVNLYNHSKEEYRMLVKLISYGELSEYLFGNFYDENPLYQKLIEQLKEADVLALKNICYTYIKKCVFENPDKGIKLDKLPELFIKENPSLFFINEEIPEKLKERYYRKTLTLDDVLSNAELFKNVSIEYFTNISVVRLLDKLGFDNLQKIYESHSNIIKIISYRAEQFYEYCRYNHYFETQTMTDFEDEFNRAIHDFFSTYNTLYHIEELMNYDFSMFSLNQKQQRIIELLGLNYIKKFEQETGFFSQQKFLSRNHLTIFDEFQMYINHNYDKISHFIETQHGIVSYEMFEKIMSKFINDMRKTNIFDADFNYDYIQGTFRKKYPEIFLDANAPDELKNVFYSNCITPDFIFTHKNLIPYLLNEHLVNCLKTNILINIYDSNDENNRVIVSSCDFITEYIPRYGNKKFLDLCSKFGSFLENITINITKNDLERIDVIENQILNQVLEMIKTKFDEGKYDDILRLDSSIFLQTLNEKQNKILNAYHNIENIKLKQIFKNYVSSNYETIDTECIEETVQILFRIEMSNSSELQAFGDLIAKQVLSQDNPLQFFSKVEEIFVKNNIPYVGKIFEVFKLLHINMGDYRNYSPLLNRFQDSKHPIQMMDLIIFNDLLKCAFGSNNRSLKNFLIDIDKGDKILTRVLNDKTLLSRLNDSDRSTLTKYLDKVEILLDSYDRWEGKEIHSETPEELPLRIHYIIDRLNLNGYHYEQIPDLLVKKFCGISGIDTFEKAKEYFDWIISETDQRNREKTKETFVLEEGDFVKGINDIKYLSRILQNGSVSKEFLGDSSNSDLTPLDTDLSRILSKNMTGNNQNELGKIINSTISGNYGSTWFILKNDPDRIEITRDSVYEKNSHNLSPKFSKLEAFQTLEDGHYGIRTGFPTSEINYIVSKSHFDRIGLEIAMNGFYIPVVDTNGKLMFTPEDYDLLRSKMAGLSYYGETNYVFSDHLINIDTSLIAEQIEQSNIETKRKRDKINAIIQESLLELGLILKDRIDGNLTEGIVEFIDTGSTGRGTNKPGDGDFDFMMRLDKSILSNPSKMNELKEKILKKLGKENSSELTTTGDFRLKQVKIDDTTSVDIDITFTNKTDKISYSTDMCLQERLSNIYNQSPQQYKYVVANILLAKQILKQGNVYKPDRGETPQGGLGGVGVENWILQNGGSFLDAAKSFLIAADGKTFEEFKNTYYIWDFGENHMAERREQYSHDNFVYNMSNDGYLKMVEVLKKYVEKYEIEQTDRIKSK